MKRVLIIDDASYMRMLIKNVIKKQGFPLIYEASNKDEAVDMFRIFQPEIVTLDMGISESWRGGIEILTHIMSVNPETIVIIISATGQEELINECLALGAKKFLRKPFDSEVLLEILESYK